MTQHTDTLTHIYIHIQTTCIRRERYIYCIIGAAGWGGRWWERASRRWGCWLGYITYTYNTPYFLVCGSDRRLGRQMLGVEQLGSSEVMRWDINSILPVPRFDVAHGVYDGQGRTSARQTKHDNLNPRQTTPKTTPKGSHFLHTRGTYTIHPTPTEPQPPLCPFSICHTPPLRPSPSQSSPTPDARFPGSSSTRTHKT